MAHPADQTSSTAPGGEGGLTAAAPPVLAGAPTLRWRSGIAPRLARPVLLPALVDAGRWPAPTTATPAPVALGGLDVLGGRGCASVLLGGVGCVGVLWRVRRCGTGSGGAPGRAAGDALLLVLLLRSSPSGPSWVVVVVVGPSLGPGGSSEAVCSAEGCAAGLWPGAVRVAPSRTPVFPRFPLRVPPDPPRPAPGPPPPSSGAPLRGPRPATSSPTGSTLLEGSCVPASGAWC